MLNVVAIAIGGALGAVCRYAVNLACLKWLGAHFAFGTLVVNVTGCFLLGLMIPLGTSDPPRWGVATHSALTIGFLGALTTFSTFGFETAGHLQNSQHQLAAANVALNLLLGVAAVFGGLALGKQLIG